ncbi:hypothetical protein T310_8641, partial [Rasamsonia emersonii CBS 393.64]
SSAPGTHLPRLPAFISFHLWSYHLPVYGVYFCIFYLEIEYIYSTVDGSAVCTHFQTSHLLLSIPTQSLVPTSLLGSPAHDSQIHHHALAGRLTDRKNHPCPQGMGSALVDIDSEGRR